MMDSFAVCVILFDIFFQWNHFFNEKIIQKNTYKTNIRLNIPKGIQKYIPYVHADMLTS